MGSVTWGDAAFRGLGLTAKWNIYKRIKNLEEHLTPAAVEPAKVPRWHIVVGSGGLLVLLASLVLAGLGAFKTVPLITALVILISAGIGLLIAIMKAWKKNSGKAGDWEFVAAFAAPAVIAALLVGAEWGAYLEDLEAPPCPSSSPTAPPTTPAP